MGFFCNKGWLGGVFLRSLIHLFKRNKVKQKGPLYYPKTTADPPPPFAPSAETPPPKAVKKRFVLCSGPKVILRNGTFEADKTLQGQSCSSCCGVENQRRSSWGGFQGLLLGFLLIFEFGHEKTRNQWSSWVFVAWLWICRHIPPQPPK